MSKMQGKNPMNAARIAILIFILIFMVRLIGADSSAATWTRNYCVYNAGAGSTVCDTGNISGDSADCDAVASSDCTEEGDVYCYGLSNCEEQGASNAGPVTAYNVNWDADPNDCDCLLGSGNYNINNIDNVPTINGDTNCCGDDALEAVLTSSQAAGTGCDDVSNDMCAGEDGMTACCDSTYTNCAGENSTGAYCMENYELFDVNEDGVAGDYCNNTLWYDCDLDSGNLCAGGTRESELQSACAAFRKAASLEPVPHGEYRDIGETECCGDDSGEYFIEFDGLEGCCSEPDCIIYEGECLCDENDIRYQEKCAAYYGALPGTLDTGRRR